MARYVELVGAALSSVAALLWLVYVVHVVQALEGAVSSAGPLFHLNMGVLTLLFLCTAALILGLSLGAYLHVVHRRRLGAGLLWICVGLLVVDLASYDFSGWGALPVTLSGSLPLNPAIWVGTTIPTILPILEVLATSFGVVAVLASLAPGAVSAVPGDRRYASGSY